MNAVSETRKIMRKAISHYSNEQNAEPKLTQIKIYSNDLEEAPRYSVLKEWEETGRELTLKELMLVPKMDFTGKGMKADMFVEPQIKNILKRLSKEYKHDIKEVAIIVAVNDNGCEDLKLILTLGGKPTKLIDLEKLLE